MVELRQIHLLMPSKTEEGVPQILLDDAVRSMLACDRLQIGTSESGENLTFGVIDARLDYRTQERLRELRQKKKEKKRLKRLRKVARKKKKRRKRFNRPFVQRPKSKPSHVQHFK